MEAGILNVWEGLKAIDIKKYYAFNDSRLDVVQTLEVVLNIDSANFCHWSHSCAVFRHCS